MTTPIGHWQRTSQKKDDFVCFIDVKFVCIWNKKLVSNIGQLLRNMHCLTSQNTKKTVLDKMQTFFEHRQSESWRERVVGEVETEGGGHSMVRGSIARLWLLIWWWIDSAPVKQWEVRQIRNCSTEPGSSEYLFPFSVTYFFIWSMRPQNTFVPRSESTFWLKVLCTSEYLEVDSRRQFLHISGG